MSRSELSTFDTQSNAPAPRDGRDDRVERAETGRPTGREGSGRRTERSAIAYCVDNDLI